MGFFLVMRSLQNEFFAENGGNWKKFLVKDEIFATILNHFLKIVHVFEKKISKKKMMCEGGVKIKCKKSQKFRGGVIRSGGG